MRTTRNLGICLLATGFLAGAAQAEGFHLEKRLAMVAGGTFIARSEGGEVVVRGGSGTEAVITITSKRADFAEHFNVRFDEGPDRVGVIVEHKDRGVLRWFGNRSGGARIEVELPEGASAEIESSGGGVEVTGLRGNVRAESSGGGVKVMEVGGDVHVESSGGGVQVEGIGGTANLESSGGGVVARAVLGDIDAESSGGGVKIEGAGGAVKASSSGGPVRVGFANGNASGGSIHSSGGGVTVSLDPTVGLDLDASSSGGRVRSDLEVAVRGRIGKDHLRGKLNGGGELLRISSSGGGVTIEGR